MNFSLRLVFATLLCGLLVGLIPTVLDGAKKPLQARFNASTSRIEWLAWLFYLAWLPTMPLVGWAVDLWGSKEILFYSLVALSLALAWLAQIKTLATACLAATLVGLAYSGVATASIHLMTRVFFPADSADVDITLASLNLGFVAVGIGALLGPALIAGVERARWSLRHCLLGVSMACILPAALVILADATEFPRSPGTSTSWRTVFSQPHVAMIVGMLLLYFALENCLEFWPEPYLRELGYHERGVTIGMIAFWLGFIGTRGLAAWWLHEHPTQGIFWMCGLAVVSALVVGNLAGGYEVGSGTLGFLLAGAAYGPLLPGLLGLAYVLFPGLPASALGGLLALSGFDTLLVRPIMRAFVRDRQPRVIMRVPVVLGLLLAAPLFLLAFLRE